ncbi:MAG: hypothetical protein M1838_006017 [Thelocarpon superellum]|nr:MAG: hypothetical protein M1838_006017 [Thelocarpon superellum]
MFQSFSGNSRRPRQINLSGRHSLGSSTASRQPAAAKAPNTLATAQQERLLRQQDRNRLNATRTIQRWDQLDMDAAASVYGSKGNAGLGDAGPTSDQMPPYPSLDECLQQLRLLLQFVDVRVEKDRLRLARYAARLQKTTMPAPSPIGNDEWMWPLLRLGQVSLASLLAPRRGRDIVPDQLVFLIFLTKVAPRIIPPIASLYYLALSHLIGDGYVDRTNDETKALFIAFASAPLQTRSPDLSRVYESCASNLLTTPDLESHLGTLHPLYSALELSELAAVLATLLGTAQSRGNILSLAPEARLWLLAHFIALHQIADDVQKAADRKAKPHYVAVVSVLLGSLADEVSQRIDVQDAPMHPPSTMFDDVDDDENPHPHPYATSRAAVRPLPPFVRQRILALVNQQSITSLLAQTDALAPADGVVSQRTTDARLLANYALSLLRIFPRRADEIRMWLYLGSTSAPTPPSDRPSTRLPAIKYFWKASKATRVFTSISQDSRMAIELLKSNAHPERGHNNRIQGGGVWLEETDEQWRIILIFFELYTFVLKVMDDDEFFSARSSIMDASSVSNSWTRASALPLEEVKDLTTFLKNLAFTMYWNASDLGGRVDSDGHEGFQSYFSTSGSPAPAVDRPMDTDRGETRTAVAGMTGMTIDYVKGIVTGLLRMIYERDSRRPFLPKDHWLMTERFDMQGFIPDVVAEEENRHRVQEADDEDGEADDDPPDEEATPSRGIIGNQHVQRTRAIELLKRRQRRASRKKYLEAVTPRLEILQNMPFFIPFTTRVQIFRAFVILDQRRRRGGHVDPDQWRMSIMQSAMFSRTGDSPSPAEDLISKHHAKIRRQSVFEDAYEQFYELGDGLKEPIQITFVDKFDTVEAGIDGGGVTKEFLTSVTNEAFGASNGLDLFVENEQHLLYPNPSAVDERKDILRQAGLPEGSPEWNEQIRDLLRRYEFLGRVIGKCLYEGILVDVGFAGFFLLKWALTGGMRSAAKESGYRANLNDLRDLDEGLYQGLLQLKNYPGNVEDFSLNFTVTDTLTASRSPPSTLVAAPMRTITRELKPNGSNMPVTNENRLVYISYIARHRLQTQPLLQTTAFLRGLGDIIQPSWLSMFNQAELQTLVGGDSSEIDVPDLRRNTLYGGVYAIGDDQQEHPSVRLFWEVMKALSDVERRKVLKFVTSTPRAPLLGFGQLNPRFSIRDAGREQDRLPSTSTCVNLLKLPQYADADVLREKLLYAINSGAGFDLS